MITPDPLDAAIVPHLQRASRLITSRMADARSHAQLGYLSFATQRLADLHHALIGPNGAGAIADAREAFYRDAHADFDADLHDPDRRYPTREGAGAARTAPTNGVDSHRELGLLIHQARTALTAAFAGNAATRATVIDTWHEQHATTLRAWARRTLSDSQISIHAVTNWLRLKQEFRDDERGRAET